MKRIFLSLGFSGRSEEKVMEDINNAKEYIKSIHKDEEIEFIHNYYYNGVNRVECLGEAIKKMSACDFVYFINNWSDHKGCVIENNICELYNINHGTIVI